MATETITASSQLPAVASSNDPAPAASSPSESAFNYPFAAAPDISSRPSGSLKRSKVSNTPQSDRTRRMPTTKVFSLNRSQRSCGKSTVLSPNSCLHYMHKQLTGYRSSDTPQIHPRDENNRRHPLPLTYNPQECPDPRRRIL